MMQIFVIAGGGALGAVLRYGISNGVYVLLGRTFPYGTLVVNVLGSLLMGLMYVLLVERVSYAAEWRAFLLVGLLGAFTTFSTFSIETVMLLENGEPLRAIVNMLLSVSLCIVATWAGIFFMRQI